MAKNSTTSLKGKVSSIYQVGDVIIFKYEGNLRASVSGHRIMDGKIWLEADVQLLSFVVPSSEVIGVEAKEERD